MMFKKESDHESDDDYDGNNIEDADVTIISSALVNTTDEKIKAFSATNQMAMEPIDEDDFYQFLLKLNLSRRQRMSETDASYALLDLQQAAAKYYFDVHNVNCILDCFPDSVYTQAKVVVALFSRIWDIGIIFIVIFIISLSSSSSAAAATSLLLLLLLLQLFSLSLQENLDYIIRNLHPKTKADIMSKLGWLNVFNPLKPAGEYTIPLTYLDDRIFLLTMLELDQIAG